MHPWFSFIFDTILFASVVVLPVPGGPNINLRLSLRLSFKLNPSSNSNALKAVLTLPIRSIWFFKVIVALVHLLHSIRFRTSSYILLAFNRRLFSLTFATSNFNVISSRFEKWHLTSISHISSIHKGILCEGFLKTYILSEPWSLWTELKVILIALLKSVFSSAAPPRYSNSISALNHSLVYFSVVAAISRNSLILLCFSSCSINLHIMSSTSSSSEPVLSSFCCDEGMILPVTNIFVISCFFSSGREKGDGVFSGSSSGLSFPSVPCGICSDFPLPGWCLGFSGGRGFSIGSSTGEGWFQEGVIIFPCFLAFASAKAWIISSSVSSFPAIFFILFPKSNCSCCSSVPPSSIIDFSLFSIPRNCMRPLFLSYSGAKSSSTTSSAETTLPLASTSHWLCLRASLNVEI